MPQLAPLTPYAAEEIAAFGLASRGVKDGSHPTESRELGVEIGSEHGCCSWRSREDVMRVFRGDVVVWDDGGTLKVSRLLPQRLTDRPEMAAVSVKRLTGHRFLGTVDDRGSPIYERAEIEFQFENLPFSLTE